MDNGTLVSGLGIAGLIAAGGVMAATWKQIRGVFTQMSRYVVCSATTQDVISDAIYVYCSEKMKPSPIRKRVYGSAKLFVTHERKRRNIPYEMLISNLLIYRKGFKFLIITQDVSKDGGWTGNLNLYFLRGTWNLDAFIKEAMNYALNQNDNHESKRFSITKYYGSRHGGYTEDPKYNGSSSGQPIRNIRNGCYRLIGYSKTDVEYDEVSSMNPLDVYAFPDDIIQAVDEAQKWSQSEKWYKSKGIPWTRGYLVHGPTGGGKTSFLRSIAQILDIHIAILDLASMSNQDLNSAWTSLKTYSPVMVLIEDIDGIFNGRKNILQDQTGTSLTFDALLNCISGVDRADGIFLGITTNNIDLVDPAIGKQIGSSTKSSRPGRIDRVIYIGPMDENCRRKLATRVLKDRLDEVESLVFAGDGMTAAQFSDMCVSRAMEIYWHDEAKTNQTTFTETKSARTIQA